MDKLSFVIVPEEQAWVAQGIEHNVVTHARDIKDLQANIELVVQGYRKFGNGAFKSLPEADPMYQVDFKEAVRAGNDIEKVMASGLKEPAYFTLDLDALSR